LEFNRLDQPNEIPIIVYAAVWRKGWVFTPALPL
jgi:hypothetical protein